MWLTNNNIKKVASDFLIIFFVFWAGAALSVVHGVSFAIEPFGILFIETMGSYLLARVFIRGPESYEFFVRCLFFTILVLIPFSLYETITAQPIVLNIFRNFGPVFDVAYMQSRWGLDRVQGPFEHPILYGVFCGMGIGMVFYSQAATLSFFTRALRTFAVLFAAIWSLSSGPLSGIVAQIMLITYGFFTKGIKARWKLAVLGAVSAYIVVDLLSNRRPAEVFISYFAFNAHNAYNRMRIWDFGSASVLNHPVFGIGYNEWERPFWMSPSVDMFWLLPSMKYGLPAGLALASAFAIIALKIASKKIEDQRINYCRVGLMITLVGLMLSGWTVHFWNATYSITCFVFGAGVWIYTQDYGTKTVSTHEDEQSKNVRRRAGVLEHDRKSEPALAHQTESNTIVPAKAKAGRRAAVRF